MKFDYSVLDTSEKIIFALRTLYREYGYIQYKMSKFEEYDLYSKNKDFLISEGIITFTDTNGKLRALKPDVTLSIIKNNRDDDTHLKKLCYNESVYRVAKGTGSFKEIMQTGLECIGNVDEACIGEVLLLAAKSMELVSGRFVLQISDLDIMSAFVDSVAEDRETIAAITKCISEKNAHVLSGVCEDAGISPEDTQRLAKLMMLYGEPEKVLAGLRELGGEKLSAEISKLENILSVFEGSGLEDRIKIDFSAVSNTKYYNGVIFKGFIEGVPGSVLSGGQYNGLMRKMHKTSDAIGFAVYLDELDRVENINTEA